MSDSWTGQAAAGFGSQAVTGASAAAVYGQVVAPLTTRGANGTLIPPPVSSGLQKSLWDAQTLRVVNAAMFGVDPNNLGDQAAAIQAVLNYAYNLRRVMIPDTSLDFLPPRQVVRVVLPSGTYGVGSVLVVPPFVSLETQGTIWRRSGGALGANLWLPCVAFAVGAHAMGQLNVNATDDLSQRGSGVAFGITFNFPTAVLAGGGSGYVVGEVITFPQPHTVGANYQPLVLTVASIGAGGSVATFTVTQPGYYPFPTSVGLGAWGTQAYSNISTGAMFTTSNLAGVGFTAIMTDEGDFAGGEYRNNAHAANAASDTLIGELHVRGCGTTGNSGSYGHQFAVLLMGMNTEYNIIQTNGGYVGVYVKYCPDVRGNKINPCQAAIGLSVKGSIFSAAEAIIDSATLCSILSTYCAALSIGSGRICWYVSNNGLAGTYGGPAQSGYQIVLGSRAYAFLSDNVRINLSISAPGPVKPYFMTAIAIAAGKGGSGWAVGNTFIVNGNFDTNPDLASSAIYAAGQGTVTAVTAGAVTAATVLYGGNYPLPAAQAVTAWGYPLNAWPTTCNLGSGVGLQVTPTFAQSATLVGAVAYMSNCVNAHLDLQASNQTIAGYTQSTSGQAYGTAARFCDFGTGVAPSCTLRGAFDGPASASIFGGTIPAMGIDVFDNTIGGTTVARAKPFGIYDIIGQGTPVSGASGTGLNKALQGSSFLDVFTGNVFQQVGPASSPNWISQPVLETGTSYQTLTTGFAITIAAGVPKLIIKAAGTLASGTITMPAAPVNNQLLKIISDKAITALTINANGGQSLSTGITGVSFAANVAYSFVYELATTTWHWSTG